MLSALLVDPSVTLIPARAFEGRMKVKLSEGLVKIGGCHYSIKKINIPNSLRRIKDNAFDYSLRTPIRLHDGIESIREYAFSHCIFSPTLYPAPLITVIHECMFHACATIFSLELPEDVREFKCGLFPPNADLTYNIYNLFAPSCALAATP